KELLDALVRQAQSDELADGIVSQVPAGGPVSGGDRLSSAEIRQQVDLESAELFGHDHAVQPRGLQLLDERWRDAAVAFGLLLKAADHGLQVVRSLENRLRRGHVQAG